MTQGIVLLAHGSRDPRWREPIEAVALRIRAQSPRTAVECAYIELSTPDFATATEALVRRGITQLRVLPLFLGMGKHAREDMPRLVAAAQHAHHGLQVELLPAVGEQDAVIELLAQLALQGQPQSHIL